MLCKCFTVKHQDELDSETRVRALIDRQTNVALT
jgi:hypothetical protein